MARLNEPPMAAAQPSADNIEVIKRRFLRQNRELAKYVQQSGWSAEHVLTAVQNQFAAIHAHPHPRK